MFTNNSDDLDPIAFWVLLLLSGGQHFTFHDIVKTMNKPYENVWDALQTLQEKKYAKNDNSKFMIDFAGVEYLTKRGILAAEAEEEPKPKDFDKKFKPPFYFMNWTELVFWLAPLFIVSLLSILGHYSVTAGYTYISNDKIIKQGAIWVLFATFVILYFWLSFHRIMQNEKLVVFRAGRVVNKRGPGNVILIPLIYNPKKVELRQRTKEFTHEPCITKDRMLIQAGFFFSWHIDDPIPSLTKVTNVDDSMTLLAAAVLRATIYECTMDEAMERRPALNRLIRVRIEHKSADWGVEVDDTEIRELQPSDQVMKQIENRHNAELERDATLVRNDAKVQSLQQFMTLGAGMARNPVAMNLKYLDTLEKIGEGASTKFIIPMELMNLLRDFVRAQMGNNNQNGDDNNPGNGNNPPGQLPGG